MTIKISQLGNVATIQGNVLLPIVSNITGTLTTVQANLGQLGTYILGNAGGNIIPLASNTYSIGNSTTWWKDLWLSENTLYIGGVPIGTSGGSLTFGGNVVGTSDLPSYTGNVSAGNIAVGATTVGNTTTAPTFSVDGSTGNITAGNISSGNITSTGDLGTYSVSTPTMTSSTIKIGYGGFSIIQGAVASITMTNPGTNFNYHMGYLLRPQGGTGTGLTIVVSNVATSGGAILEWDVYNPGEGYTAGDTVTIGGDFGVAAQFTIDSTNDSGTMTAGSSTWTYDPSGDTTLPGNITLPDNTAIYNVDANTAVFTSNVNSDATSLYLTDAGNVAVYASDYIVLETNSDGNVTQQWAFNQNGNIRFPDATTQSTAFSNTAPVIATLLSNSATQSDLIIGINANVTSANVGMKGYVDSQSFYSNAKVNTYLPTYSGNIANVTVSGQLAVFGNVFVANTYTPALANSAGIAGQIAWNTNYIYICIAANTWKRANVSTW